MIREQEIAFSMNVVLHRANIGRLRELIAYAQALGAERLELANTQFYGWAYVNRAHLLPTRGQVDEARRVAIEEKERLGARA